MRNSIDVFGGNGSGVIYPHGQVSRKVVEFDLREDNDIEYAKLLKTLLINNAIGVYNNKTRCIVELDYSGSMKQLDSYTVLKMELNSYTGIAIMIEGICIEFSLCKDCMTVIVGHDVIPYHEEEEK